MTRPRTSWIDAHVGAKLRLARQLAGRSQQELSKGLDVTFQQVQKYEQGTNRLPVAKLLIAARLLSQPLAFFVPELDNPQDTHNYGDTPDGCSTLIMETAEEGTLLTAFRNIQEASVRRRVLALVRELGTRKTI